ncbi:MAG TPA: PIN domain-containing protein [Solirubrobacteraceae bacterium]|nr:PIN domain-containing protein [Solirubrobacteraceae bacterium]
MRRGADTSVLVPALLSYHEAHEQCDAALAETDCAIAHVIAETYSVLTRLPHPLRVSPATAAAALEARLPESILALGPDAHRTMAGRLARADVSGGAAYDGLVALTASEHDVEIVSRDRRSVRTYESLGARHVLLPA